MIPKFTALHAFPLWLPQTQTWMYHQVAELQRLGVNAQVVCERTENLDQFNVANIHCLSDEPKWQQVLDRGLRALRVRRHLNYLVSVGQEVGAQIVHSHFGNIGWTNLGATRHIGAKHVVTFYGYDVNRLPTQFPIWKKRYQELFHAVDLVLCEGSHMASCITALGCSAQKVSVQHLGVDIDGIEFKPRLRASNEPLRVLIAASFREKKGIPYAIEALAKISTDIPLEITLIGDAGNDRASQFEKTRILKGLAEGGLIEKTRLMGYQPHEVLLREAYRHHIFLQPSVTAADGDTEGGAPVSIIEMLTSGMPVVASTHCDIPEVVGPHLQHLLAPERNVSVLVECIRNLTSSPGCWEQLSRYGREHIEREYNLKTQSKRLLAMYKGLCNAH